MKKGLKFWSKLLIASFFLGGIATSAMAQNGRVTANCGKELVAVTRTVDQINDPNGTTIPLKFTGVAENDKYYFVATTGASFTAITASCITGGVIGDNLTVIAPTADAPDANGVPSSAGTFSEDGQTINVTVKATNAVSGGDVLYLGVFVQNGTTGCFSDVYWVRINVQGNIYAYLNLNGTDSDQYICNLGTTMDLGITLCNLPADGKFQYTVTATNKVAGATVEGVTADQLRIISSATGDAGDIPLTPGTPSSTWKNIVKGTNGDAILNIGTQTLKNRSANIAGELEFAFTNMVYRYLNDEGDSVVLPVRFILNAECNSVMDDAREGRYDSIFNVHVAPSFDVQALAFKDDATRDAYTQNPAGTMSEDATLLAPEFCQGTYGYFRAINSTTEGDITYAWTGTPTLDNAASATPNATIQFTDLTTNAYALNVVATWNKDANFGAGCTASDEMPITINKAPILLLATDNDNSTDQITAPVICPGQPIALGVDIDPTTYPGLAVDALQEDRETYMNNGAYVKSNGATMKWTVSYPDGVNQATDGSDEVLAYTAWRPADAKRDGTATAQPLTQNFTSGTVLADFLNNATTGQQNIIYTVESTGACKLVKVDGSALKLDANNENTGKVMVVYPVQPRPQFTLGAN